MNCAQRILYNGINAARTAALIASSVRPAVDSIRTLPTARDGSAAVALSGAFTGANDAAFDVEIVDTTVSTPIVSQPQFVGTGNGELSAISFSGAAQGFTLELADAGTEEAYAAVPFANTKITARAAGAAGNGITITVDTSGLTFTATDWSLLDPLPKDTRRSDATALDFGAALMGADNRFPAAAKRLAFGPDRANIHRQAKQWVGDKWEYVFEPPIARYLPKGERVYEVTGTYSVTVAQGMVTNTYTGIRSNYDLLLKLNTLDPLVRVDGVIANDTAISGQAAGDLSLRTAAFARPPVGSGGDTVQAGRVDSIYVAPGAAQEVIELRCWAVGPEQSPNAHLGREIWEVVGSISGSLGNFFTGDTVAPGSGDWSLVMPSIYPNGYPAAHGSFTVESIDMPRSGEVQPPPVCPVALTLGPAAVDQLVTLVYKRRPAADCSCDGLPVPDFSSSVCLLGSNNPNNGGSVSYPAAIEARMASLWDWYADLVQDYTDDHVLRANAGGSPTGTMDESSRATEARRIAALMEKTAIKVAADSGALALWDAAFTDLKAHFSGEGDGPATATAAEAIAAGSFVEVVGGRIYLARGVGSTSGGVGTVFKSYCTGYSAGAISLGGSVSVETLSFPDTSYLVKTGYTADTVYVVDPATPGALAAYTGTGTYAGFSATAVRADLLRVADYDSGSETEGRYFNVIYARFAARCDAVLADAGISPLGKADATVVSDDGCWQDFEDVSYYWEVTGSVGGGYMPAFTNEPYVSCRNTNGAIASTREFAFQINVNPDCIGGLKVNDSITLRIGNASWPATYQVGDRMVVEIVGAAPLTLAGGVDGSLDQKWHVTGDVHGPFAVFTAAGGSGSYSDSGLAFTLTSGGIRFAKGDRFAFSAEGGHWQWRKDGGGWVGPLAIGSGAVVLSDGVSATITPGAAPSFVPGDRYSFAVRQPNAPANVQNPNEMAWRWVGATATLDIDLGSAQAFDSIALPRHRLPSTATINVQAGTSSGAADVLAATPIAWHAGTLALLLANAVTARYVRITLTGATDGALGWVYVGAAYQPTLAASLTGLRREYVMDRGSGVNPAARYVGSGSGGVIEWQEGGLVESDFTALVAMVDWLKSQGDEPLMFFYSTSRPTESLLARVDSDQVELRELMDYQPMAGVDRFFEARLGLSAVIA